MLFLELQPVMNEFYLCKVSNKKQSWQEDLKF